MWPFKKKEKHQVFFTTDEWAIRKYSPIQPAKNFMPLDFQKMESFVVKNKHMIDSRKTVKTCPGILDFCSAGYVIPAWCDIEIEPTSDGMSANLRYSHWKFKNGSHPPESLQNFMKNKFTVRLGITLDNPWSVWTAKGYSLMYMPMYYYDDTRNWEAIPGWVDSDLVSVSNPINILLKEPKYTFIKQGEPIVQVIPIKREPFSAYSGNQNSVAIDRYNSISFLHDMNFSGWIKYIRDKKIYKLDSNDTDLPNE